MYLGSKSSFLRFNSLSIYPEIKSIIIHFKKNHKKLPEDFLFYEKIENLSNYTKITSSFLFPQNLSLENQIINKFHFSSLISSNMIYNLQFKFDSNSAFLPVIYGFTPPTQHETFSLVYEYLTKSNEEFLQYNFYLNSWNKFNQELIIVSDPQHPIEMKISINYLLTLGQWIKVFGLYLPLWSFSITVLSLWGPKGLFAKEYYIEEEEKTNEKDSKKSNEKKSNEKNILNQNPPSFMDILAFYFFRALILFPIIIIITFIIDKIIAPNLLENQASFPWPISVFLAMICGFALVTMFATFSYIFIFISTFIVKIFKPIFAKNSNQNSNQNSNPNSNQNQNQNQNQNSKFLSFAFLSIFILDFALIFFLHPIFDYFFNLFLRFLFTIFIKTKTQTSNAQTKYNLKLLFNKQIGLCSSSLFLSLMFVPSLMMWKQYLEYYGFFYSQYKIRPIILLSIPIILLLKKDIWEAISLGSLQKYISFQQSKMETQKILIKIAISLYLISLVIVLLFFMDKIYYIQDFFCLISIIELISMAIPVKKLKEKQD
ncbi:rab-gap/tbc-related [Anaeramoeba ignava]|uniref:Rab-gap/tbc-related n=1 Tax=Anaeramoeba ignava TaxID=1746090 RepID=A0A9Q0LFJ3_ANAIG|nr:rab-gap/tbc-related [Anaeramoeba ignava]